MVFNKLSIFSDGRGFRDQQGLLRVEKNQGEGGKQGEADDTFWNNGIQCRQDSQKKKRKRKSPDSEVSLKPVKKANHGISLPIPYILVGQEGCRTLNCIIPCRD